MTKTEFITMMIDYGHEKFMCGVSSRKEDFGSHMKASDELLEKLLLECYKTVFTDD